jgi:hypothetical protein
MTKAEAAGILAGLGKGKNVRIVSSSGSFITPVDRVAVLGNVLQISEKHGQLNLINILHIVKIEILDDGTVR